ncbi:MAG: AI-2E family transporter, partial [Acidimicrobiia bacterium]|nr:AI-2E family transporter [Acidimicrobiia bacterium]
MAGVVVSIRLRTIVISVLVAALAVVLLAALDATRQVVAELILAAAVALLVRPGVLWLARRTRMGVALAAVFIGLVVGVAGIVGGEASALSGGAKQLQHVIPDRLDRFQQQLPVGNPIRRFLVGDDVVARVRHSIDGLPSRFILGTDSPARGASQLGEILLVASLAAFMVTQLPKSIEALVDRLPVASRESARRALRAGYSAGGSHVRRTLALGAACALAGGLVGAGAGVPGAAVVALWLGMWALVPKLGIVVGGLPLIGLAAGQGTAQGVATVLALAVIAVAGEWSRRRWIERRTVTVGSLLSLVAFMTGMELGRWPGALVALVAVAALLAGVDSIRQRAGAVPRMPDGAALAPSERGQGTDGDVPSGRRQVPVEIDTRSLVLTAVVALALVVVVGLIRA